MHKTAEQKSFYTPDEAHDIIGKDCISRRALYNALNRTPPEIPCVRLGHKFLIPARAFEQWLAGQGTK